MKGDNRKHKRKLKYISKVFDKKKNAIMQAQLDLKIFFGKELNDKLVYHLAGDKVYSKLNNRKQLASKTKRRMRNECNI